MAKRYVRTVRLERCAEHEVDLRTGQLAYQLAELAENQFLRSAGWVHRENQDAVFDLEVASGPFRGQIEADQQTDVEQRPGEGTVRKFNIKVSAECCNAKRRGARELQLGMEHKTAALFGVLGGIGLTMVAGVAEALLFEMIHFRLLLIVFFVGSAICAGIGSYFGSSMGGMIGNVTARTTVVEEKDFSESGKAWETFIDELAEVVDEFAQEVEESPSKATMI